LWPEQKALLRERFGEPVRWLTGGLLALLLFLPWVPMLLAQVARVSDQYWIQKSWMTVHTVPSSIYQFVAYDHLDRLRGYWHEAPLLLLAALIGFCFWRFRSRWREIVLFLSLFLVPPLIMWGYSELRTPVYLDRYFPFAAVGLYLFLALGVLAFRNRWVRAILVALMAGVMLFGNWLVYNSGNHQMREAAQAFAGQYRPGDAVVSADLYTFFDFSYYNRTGEPAKLLDRGSLTYGEPGLLKGREHLRVRSLSEISAPNGRVWAVGKPGERAYWREVPPEWRLEETIRRGSVEIRLYRVNQE
jgi:mannosyltransferase